MEEPKEGSRMYQKLLGASNKQYWEFIKQDDGTYLICLKNTELYLTAESEEQNSEIILRQLKNSDDQKWRLIKQNPIV